MKMSRSESMVLREIVRSKDRGLSNKEVASALSERLSPQGLAHALKVLQSKGLVYRDILASEKISGAHASYKSTAASFEPVFLNDAAEFILSKETATIEPSIGPSLFYTANCLYPRVRLMSEAKDPFSTLRDNEDFGRKLRDVTDLVTSTWLDYRMKTYDQRSLKIVEEYEDALASYLSIFGCKLRRWAPGAAKEVMDIHHRFVDPFDMVGSYHSIDWPLKKYHMFEEELEWHHENFPNADDELSGLSEQLRKLNAIVYDKRKKRVYEEYLKALVPHKTLMLLDFGVSGASLRKHAKSQEEAFDALGEEGNIGEIPFGSVA